MTQDTDPSAEPQVASTTQPQDAAADPGASPSAPARPTREQILAALAAATGQGDAGAQSGDDEYHSRIVIKPDGEVLIENLSVDLMELALMLDPDAEIGCELPQPAGDEPPAADASQDAASAQDS